MVNSFHVVIGLGSTGLSRPAPILVKPVLDYPAAVANLRQKNLQQ
jgi:hypothetical protein